MSDVDSFTLAEKAQLSSGADFWTTPTVGGVPSIMLTDGPHGLRKQGGAGDHLGVNESVPATCFPPASGIGQAWNPALVERVGGALGRECRAERVGVLLGPGVNIRRSPLGGRNFEYFSEDPVLSAALGTAWVHGVQAEGVGASLKHFAVNNQEDDRQRVSAEVAARPLREIYLRSFQRVVEEAQPWTVMSSYNRVNGEYVGESEFFLTQVLREEWGFEGVVVSDWGAVVDRVAAAAAGLDLEMPSSDGRGAQALLDAIADGRISEDVLTRIASRVAELARKASATAPLAGFDVDQHHELARDAARQSIVLLRNEGGLLPLSAGASVAVIGDFAQHPRYQGGGSSHVRPTRVDIPLDEIREVAQGEIRYAQGFTTDGSGADPTLVAEAVQAAAAADVAVVFLGLPEALESEGWDRDDIELPAEQLAVALAVLEVNPRTVVVLSHGGVVRLAPLDAVPALLDGALLGQGGGRAIAETLFGLVNPSGRLTETVPVRLEDTPAFLSFPGEHSRVRYDDGLFVGYRWYDARQQQVTFPFGHGLSYTTFQYDNLNLVEVAGGVQATVTIRNTGERAGREVAQFYVSVPESRVQRARRALTGFGSVELEAGQCAEVTVLLRTADLAYWDDRVEAWVTEPGTYTVEVGASSRDLRQTASITLAGDTVTVPFTRESTLGELAGHPAGAAFVQQILGGLTGDGDEADGDGESAFGSDMARMMASFPLDRMVGFSRGVLTEDSIESLLSAVNARATAASATP